MLLCLLSSAKKRRQNWTKSINTWADVIEENFECMGIPAIYELGGLKKE